MTTSDDTVSARVGAVLIGRNEGTRLIGCLASIPPSVDQVVYVDSGSTDGSVQAAENAGALVVKLDLTTAFTAARARNEGFAALRRIDAFKFVQFLDGDCTLSPNWIEAARDALIKSVDVAVVCGRRREKAPEHSVFNRLCDWEWNTPIGAALTCGGDAMMRADAYEEASGFDPKMIAGEEPELCLRLRALGWRVLRLDLEMTLHDAAMTHWSQWWNRSRRAGFAAAEGAAMHGRTPERHGVASTCRAVFWGLLLPSITLVAFFATPWALALLLVYPAQIVRLALREGVRTRFGWEKAAFMTLGKFPEAQGVLEFMLARLLRRPARLIEYK